MSRPAPATAGFLSLYDALFETWWFVGPFADPAAAAAWCAQWHDPALCVARLTHDSRCGARWHLAPQLLDATTARIQGLCDDDTDGARTRIDPSSVPSLAVLDQAIAALVKEAAGSEDGVPVPGAADDMRDRPPILAGADIRRQVTTMLDRLLEEVQVTQQPRPWTVPEIARRRTLFTRWLAQPGTETCVLCAGACLDTARIVAELAECASPVVHELLPRLPMRICLRCGLAEVGLAPHPRARRWTPASRRLPDVAAAVFAQLGRVEELAYELDGRDWMLAIGGVWYALTGTRETALRHWRESLQPIYGGGTVSAA